MASSQHHFACDRCGGSYFAYGVNALGTWLGEIALAVVVLGQTGSPVAVAAVGILGSSSGL
jgi:hypothetical protein